jgi:BTB/POZ domain-containing protein 1/2
MRANRQFLISSDMAQQKTANVKNKGQPQTPNWQLKKKTAFDRFSALFLSPTLSDVTFVVGEDAKVQSIPGHRLILSMSSPVFDAMFNGPSATDKTEVRLTDEKPEAFKAVLRYLYTDKPQLNKKIAMATLYSAKKYMLHELEEECEAFITENLNCRNVISVYQQVI